MRKIRETRLWESARAEGTAESYEKFVESFPHSALADTARRRLRRMLYPLASEGFERLKLVKTEAFRCMGSRRDGTSGDASSRAYQAIAETVVTTEDLSKIFGWNGVETLARIPDDQGAAGVYIDEHGRQVLFGSLCFGNIQFKGPVALNRGQFILKENAVLLHQ